MALDTIVLAATASPPGYSSVVEFAAALAPYTRPDRAQVLRGVYLRAAGIFSPTRREATPAEDPVPAPAPPTEPVSAVPAVEAVQPGVLAFQRSRSRTPFIVPEAAPTSTLFNHEASAGAEQPDIPAPDRRTIKDFAESIKRRIVAVFQALAERLRPLLGAILAFLSAIPNRLRPLLGALLAFLSAIPNRLRPLAKPLSVAAVAAVALAAVGLSGWLLVTTFMRPSTPAPAPGATARVEAPVATVAVAAPAPLAKRATKVPVALPVAPSSSAAAAKTPAATAPVPTSVTSTAIAPASARPEGSIVERATATVDRAIAAILPPPTPRRSTSIVLEPDRAPERTARPSARAASARPAPTPSSSAPVSPSAPPESAPAIELQAAAPPVAAEVVAAPAAVAPKYPEPPPPATIYSSADAEVVPPVQTYPRYVESIGPDYPNASPFQVVIDEHGMVESAILARYPVNMRQAVSGTMLLAAAKAWRFQPATKDGYPVKYRRIIWFSNQ